MNRLVRADLKRIVAKPTLYLVVIIMVIIVMALDPSDTAAQQMEFYRTFFNTIGLTFVLIPVYLSVYADELNSGIMISVIGMGMPRRRVVRSKLTDAFFLLLGTYLILFIAAFIKNCTSNLAITPKQNAFLLLFCMFCVIRGIGIIALSSLVLFLTMSSASGMLVLVLAGVTASGLLKTAQDKLNFPIYDLSYIGLLDASFADFQAGSFGASLIPALFYLLVVVIINIVTFDRKEMDL